MRVRLTERQNQVYEYVRTYVRKHRKPPTLKEIGDDLAIRSTNGVHKLVSALVQKGYLRRKANEARGIALVGEDEDPFALGEGPPVLPLISRTRSDDPGGLRRRPGGALYVDPRLLRGRAGAADPDDCFLARAGDDGMVGAGIYKGDLLVVEETDWKRLDNGETVAVLFGETLLVRRFDFANGRLHFRPADRTYSEDVYPPGDPDCHVVGRVLSIMRTL
jgi:repressor LexA